MARTWYLSVAAIARGFHTCSITEIGFVRVSVVTGLQPDIPTAPSVVSAEMAEKAANENRASDDESLITGKRSRPK